MALPVIPDTLRVAFNWVCSGQHAANVLHLGGTENDYPSLVAALNANTVGNFTGTVVGEASCTQISVTPLDGTSATTDLAISNMSGNVGSSDFAPAVAAVISLKTALRGKSFRGRVFLPFTAESIITQGRFASPLTAAVTGKWQDFVAGMAAAGHPLLVASYKLGVANPVITATMNPAAGTMRKRQSRLRL